MTLEALHRGVEQRRMHPQFASKYDERTVQDQTQIRARHREIVGTRIDNLLREGVSLQGAVQNLAAPQIGRQMCAI